MSFYITLPSDSSQRFFPENTLSHFVTQLPTPVTLNGEWEVGLAEIIYPHTWYNVNASNNLFGFDLGDGQLSSRRIPPGYYETIPDILKAVTLAPFRDKIQFQYNASTKRVKIQTDNGAKIIFDKQGIGSLLGFEPQIVEGKQTSPFIADPNAVFPLLYIYSDIVSPQIVGDVQAPLLRIVRVNGKDGETVSVHYDRPHYLPVSRQCFQSIEVETRLNSGEYVPFERGKLIIVLHFRRRQIL